MYQLRIHLFVKVHEAQWENSTEQLQLSEWNKNIEQKIFIQGNDLSEMLPLMLKMKVCVHVGTRVVHLVFVLGQLDVV